MASTARRQKNAQLRAATRWRIFPLLRRSKSSFHLLKRIFCSFPLLVLKRICHYWTYFLQGAEANGGIGFAALGLQTVRGKAEIGLWIEVNTLRHGAVWLQPEDVLGRLSERKAALHHAHLTLALRGYKKRVSTWQKRQAHAL